MAACRQIEIDPITYQNYFKNLIHKKLQSISVESVRDNLKKCIDEIALPSIRLIIAPMTTDTNTCFITKYISTVSRNLISCRSALNMSRLGVCVYYSQSHHYISPEGQRYGPEIRHGGQAGGYLSKVHRSSKSDTKRATPPASPPICRKKPLNMMQEVSKTCIVIGAYNYVPL